MKKKKLVESVPSTDKSDKSGSVLNRSFSHQCFLYIYGIPLPNTGSFKRVELLQMPGRYSEKNMEKGIFNKHYFH